MDMNDDEAPLALRRGRRSNFGVRIKTEPDTLPEVKTPRRSTSKRRVRFSDSAANTTGLTPMVRRTLLSTPSSSRRRRVSAPAISGTPSSRSTNSTATSADGQNLHQVQDGRVDRRQRRSILRTALEKLDFVHQKSARQAKSEITQLREELLSRDREIYELQNATIIVDNDRLWELEQQVDDLRGELQEAQQRQQLRESSPMDWTFGSRQRHGTESHHGDEVMMQDGFDADDEDIFGETTMGQLMCSTPSRARSSFPTPPATSPPADDMMTPTMGRFQTRLKPMPTPHPPILTKTTQQQTGTQASLPDPVVVAEMDSLQRETRKLTETLNSHKSLLTRLAQRLPHESPAGAAEDDDTIVVWGPETVEKQVEAILQTLSDRTAALTSLNTTISTLGFPGSDASDMITSLASSFRAARLELEYLTPGEITLPLTSKSAQVLDLMLARLRELSHKVKEGDETIDEYHAIELNLRQQLDARVAVMDELKADLAQQKETLGGKETQINDLEVGNDRLKGAVEGYVRDISELETLVEKMESEVAAKDGTVAERDAAIADLEKRLKQAATKASDLQDELEVAQASRKRHLDTVNRRSGEALALRDARVSELKSEVDRINRSLRTAHETICRLRVETSDKEKENQSLRAAMEGMKGELQRVMRMSEELLKGDVEEQEGDNAEPGEFLSGRLARRSSKKRRRYDSGLGFLDEDEVDVDV